LEAKEERQEAMSEGQQARERVKSPGRGTRRFGGEAGGKRGGTAGEVRCAQEG